MIGLGISGIGAVKFLVSKQHRVYVYDKDKKRVEEMLLNNIIPSNVCILKKISVKDVVSVDRVVVSPGVLLTKKERDVFGKLNIEIISELELGAENIGADMIAVTGTNGKTTTSILINEILSKKYKTHLVGNIGKSIVEEVGNIRCKDKVVIEVSSFQLEEIKHFKPKCVAILNIAPDHLDRYKHMDNYIEAKRRILKNVDNKTLVILNKDDKIVESMRIGCGGQVRYISTEKQHSSDYLGAWVDNGVLHYRDRKQEFSMDIKNTKLKGKHNEYNTMVAVIIAVWFNVSFDDILGGIRNFELPKHRMQEVGIIDGAKYINDSKATNTHASMAGVSSISEPIVLLLGGSDKGENIKEYLANLPENVKCVITFGKMGGKIYKILKKLNKVCVIQECFLEGAFYRATKVAQKGDVVLLSPAMASFDEFSSYEERGEFFEYLVKGD